MRLERVNVDTRDPLQVYRLVHAHLRGELGGAPTAAASPARQRAGPIAPGLGAMPAGPRPDHARRVHSSSTARRGRPTGGAVPFEEWFANARIETLWRRNALAASDLDETHPVLTDVPPEDYRGAIGTDVQPMGTWPANHILTASEQYSDVSVRAQLWGADLDALAFARATGDGDDVLSGYAIRHDSATRDLLLLRIDGGVPTTIASGSASAGLVKDLRIECIGDQISGGIGGLTLNATDATYSRGRIGFGQNASPREWYCYYFRASVP